MFQTLFGINMSIFKGAMAPGSEVTFFFNRHLRFYSKYHNPIKEIFNFCDCLVRLMEGIHFTIRSTANITNNQHIHEV